MELTKEMAYAMEAGNEAEVRRPVTTRGADVNAKGPNDFLPLHVVASCYGKLEMMRTLVELGANLNAKGPNNGRKSNCSHTFRCGRQQFG
jgi:hypothetical protein